MSDWSWEEIEDEWARNPDDLERQAGWHLLSTLDERITDAFVGDTRPTGLDEEKLIGQSWSQTERITAAAAWTIYRGRGSVDLGRLVRFFSDRQFQRFREALSIYRGDRPVHAGEDQ